MLLESFSITHILECLADPTKIRAMAALSNHIDRVFPYLNAVLRGAAYSPEARIMILKKEHRLITLYPHMVTIAKADDEDDAGATLEWLQRLINDTWERRDTITPSYERHQLLRPLDIYSLLPKENCKRCGEATCFAFACALLTGSQTLAACALLALSQHRAKSERLSALLEDAGLLRV